MSNRSLSRLGSARLASVRKIVAIGVGAAILAGRAFADDHRQFDLICKGVTKTVTGPKAPEQWSSHLSVDLESNRWCTYARECADVYKIANAQPDIVTLAHRQTYYDLLDVSFSLRSGHINWAYDYNASVTLLTEGTCEFASFTAFPPSSHMSDDTGPDIGPPPVNHR